MSDEVSFLEARVGQLEMENKWPKGSITEKNLKGRSDTISPRKDSTKQNREKQVAEVAERRSLSSRRAPIKRGREP